jgi:transcriptional regulator with XRE-family HTH domain
MAKNELAAFILKRRTEMGLSLRKLEERSGVSNPYLSSLEQGLAQEPSPEVLRGIATGLETPYLHLMALAEKVTPFEIEEYLRWLKRKQKNQKS